MYGQQPTKKNENEVQEIFYHILAWYEDEGDYQPTEEEARKKVDAIISEATRLGEEEGYKRGVKTGLEMAEDIVFNCEGQGAQESTEVGNKRYVLILKKEALAALRQKINKV